MKRLHHLATFVLLGGLTPTSLIFGQVVGTYYADWSIFPVSPSGQTRVGPGQFTALAGLNLVVEFGDGNVSSSPPYYTVVGGGADSTKYMYSDAYNPDGRWINWQDSLSRSVHRNGGKVLITIQAVNPSALESIQSDSAKTEIFCMNAAQYAKRRGLDGLEVDEEYWQMGPPSNAVLARFYRILRRRVDEAFLPTRGIIVLTTGRSSLSTYSDVNKSDIDYVFFMLYDYQWVWSVPLSAAVSYHISPLYPNVTQSGTNAAGIVTDGPANWAAAGWPKSKLIFGIPAYGFVFLGASGLLETYSSYSEISGASISTLTSSGGVATYDNTSKIPYVAGTANKSFSVKTTSGGTLSISSGTKFFASYENTQSLQAKWDYITAMGFGGMFLYDVGGDVDPSKPGGTYTPLHTAMVGITSGATPPTQPTGTLTVTPQSLPVGGGSVTLQWSSMGATSASIDNGIGSVATSGSRTATVTSTTIFHLTLTNGAGSTAYADTVTVAQNPPTGALSATPPSLAAGGGNVTLQWTSTGATSAAIDQGIGTVALSGSRNVQVSSTTIFHLTLANSAGSRIYADTVTVVAPVGAPTGTFGADPIVFPLGGGSVTLTWTSTDAASASIDNGVGSVPLSGSIARNVTGTTEFHLSLTNTSGTQIYTAIVTVAPSGSLVAAPASLPPGGGSVTLTWTSVDATSASIDQGIGAVSFTGSQSIHVSATTVFHLSLTNSAGSTVYADTVAVASAALKDFSLEQNYPNPFNPTTNIIFKLPAETMVRLTVCTLLGQQVITLVNQRLPAGTYSVPFDSRNLSTGTYYYTLVSADYAETRRMVVVK